MYEKMYPYYLNSIEHMFFSVTQILTKSIDSRMIFGEKMVQYNKTY